MPIPTAPTATTIVTEAYRKFGVTTPNSTQVQRAIDYGLESVKDDIAMAVKKLKSVQMTAYIPTIVGVSKYQAPTDYDEILSVSLFDGPSRATLASVGSTSSLTLAASEASAAVGSLIAITSGVGTNQVGQIQAYDTSTKVATLAEALETLPVAGNAYLIVNAQIPLSVKKITTHDEIVYPFQQLMPCEIYHYSDSTEGDFYTDSLPDKVYMLRIRYYINVQKIDLSSTLYATLLRLWKRILIQGTYVWVLEENSDDRYEAQQMKYERMLRNLVGRGVDGVNLSNLQREVSD